MKKWLWMVILPVFLTACAVEEPLETVADVWSIPAAPVMREIRIDLPEDSSINTIQCDAGQLYLCDGYEISIETMEAGDLERTIQTVSGKRKEDLTILTTENGGIKRHEFVWASAGENGDRVGRALILDDGDYHYVLTVLRDSREPEGTKVNWNDVFRSFDLY